MGGQAGAGRSRGRCREGSLMEPEVQRTKRGKALEQGERAHPTKAAHRGGGREEGDGRMR